MSDNLLSVVVYFTSLNVQKVEESPQYSVKYFNYIGLGFSQNGEFVVQNLRNFSFFANFFAFFAENRKKLQNSAIFCIVRTSHATRFAPFCKKSKIAQNSLCKNVNQYNL